MASPENRGGKAEKRSRRRPVWDWFLSEHDPHLPADRNPSVDREKGKHPIASACLAWGFVFLVVAGIAFAIGVAEVNEGSGFGRGAADDSSAVAFAVAGLTGGLAAAFFLIVLLARLVAEATANTFRPIIRESKSQNAR